MKQHYSKAMIASLFAITLCTMVSKSSAQGVAGSPFTIHAVQPGPQIIIGNATAPMAIDLDPSGGPWLKSIGDPLSAVPGPAIVDMYETIQNVGIESWGDWHEHLLPAPVGLVPSTWTSVLSLAVNGNPISFTATGLGTQTLDLFNFSQPVLPGDVFTIHKQVTVAGSGGVSGAFLRIQEYPTPYFVPEPCSLLLVASCGLLALGKRPRR